MVAGREANESHSVAAPPPLEYASTTPRRSSVLGLVLVLLIAGVITVAGLLMTAAAAALLLARWQGEPEAPAFIAVLFGPVGVILLIGGGFVTWRAIAALGKSWRRM